MKRSTQFRRLRCERLEDRRLLATYTVDSLADSGPGSLRDAIGQANSTPDYDEIVFAPELSGGTIVFGSAISIGNSLSIDATSLPDGITLDGNSNSRLLKLDTPYLQTASEFRGFTFTRAYGALEVRGSAIVDECSFIANTYTPIINFGSVTVANSFFAGARSNTSGPYAIYNAGDLTLINSTIAGDLLNTAIESRGSGNVTIDTSTIGGVYAGGWPMIVVGSKPIIVRNSIIDGYVDGPVTASYSLLSYVNVADVTGEGNLLNVNPQLGPLADNGGARKSFALMPGSPALDAGDSSYAASTGAVDARGEVYHRQVGRLDMGAYEAQAVPNFVPGDFNEDGSVNLADYTLWRDNLGSTVEPFGPGDATGDGLVTADDYDTWKAHFGLIPTGQSLVVNSLEDYDDLNPNNGVTTLREALNLNSRVGWVHLITFDPALSGRVIHVTGYDNFGLRFLHIDNPVTVDARMLPEGIIIDADNPTAALGIYPSLLDGNESYDVTLAGLHIRGSSPRGVDVGIDVAQGGKLIFLDGSISDTDSAIHSEGVVELRNTVVERIKFGDAAIDAVEVRLENSIVRDVGNESKQMHGVSAQLVTLVDSTITQASGAGILAAGDVFLERSRVEDNGGSGIYAEGNVLLERSRIEHNGGNGVIAKGQVHLVDSHVSHNVGSSVRVTGRIGGAGIQAIGDVTLVDSHVDFNSYQVTGGTGIGIQTRGRLIASGSSISGNDGATYSTSAAAVYAEGRKANGSPIDAGIEAISLDDCVIEGNKSAGSIIYGMGSIGIRDTTVQSNEMTYRTDTFSSVILIAAPSNATLMISDSTLEGNITPTDATLTSTIAQVSRTEVTNNQSSLAARSVIDCVISDNTGFGVTGSYDLEIVGTTIRNNAGGVRSYNVTIRDSSVVGNSLEGNQVSSSSTGWIVPGIVASELVWAERVVIADNTVNYTGTNVANRLAAGISGRQVVLIDSSVENNSAAGPGLAGGIWTERGTIVRSTIAGNIAVGEGVRGGGIYAKNSVNLYQSTISANRVEGANAQGGGVWTASALSTQSTIAENTAVGEGAAGGGAYVYFSTSASNITGTVLHGNNAPVGPDLLATGVNGVEEQLSVSHSLVGNPDGSSLATGGLGPGNLLNVDAMLGPLADNGGPTPTHLPLEGSPLIDAGNSVITTLPSLVYGSRTFTGAYDQRGEPYIRIVDGGSETTRIDIGAVEVQFDITPAESSNFLSEVGVLGTEPSDQGRADALDLVFANDDSEAVELLALLASDVAQTSSVRKRYFSGSDIEQAFRLHEGESATEQMVSDPFEELLIAASLGFEG